ncbi:MAG TPA: suppressor of fused domain protein [Frankiaceae bacterium]|nr:suppressor of fused domain protein [Frankiaceae bacterium]
MSDDVLAEVEERLVRVLGPAGGRAGVTFLGAEPVEVLRFSHGDLTTYVTLGMSRAPLPDPSADVVKTEGPRAELTLTLRGARDGVLRAMAVFAMSPFVENAVVAPGASLDLGAPLWPGSRFVAVLVGEPGAIDPVGDVAFYPLVPMTANEAAFKRVHGAAALEERWLSYGTDPRDPDRAEVPLG